MSGPVLRRLKIRTKLVLLVGLLLGLIAGGILAYLPGRARQAELRALATETDAIARMTAYSVAPALLFEDRRSAQEALAGARVAGRVAYAVVTDEAGEPVATLDLQVARQAGVLGGSGGENFYRTAAPVERDGTLLGTVHVGASLAAIEDEHAVIVRGTAVLGALVFLVGLAATWAIGSVVTRPLRQMVGTARRIGAGHLDLRARTGAGDEAGELAKSFNEMLDRLEGARSELEALNRDLERRVEEGIGAYRRLEEQYHHAQRMEAVGRLAGGVAHDFNNLLTAILGYTELALQTLPDGGPERAHLEEIRKAGERAAALTQQLLNFSRKQVVRPRVLDLNEVVLGLGRMMQRLIGETIHVDNRLRPGSLPVRADRGQLEQVVVNIVVNARDAMPAGGTILLRTAELSVGDGGPWSVAGATPGRYVLLEISDSGTGMDEQTRARIFEPFFTTKALGVGTGLGMATVYSIVSQNGGHIRIASELGRGTAVGILLPWCLEAPAEEIAAAAEPELQNGSETVLVVEDEDAVRNLMAGALRSHGYRVLTASSGEEALAASERHPEAIHLVVTDVVMPGLGGRETVEELRRRRPRLPALYVSGYTDDTVLQNGVSSEETPFLGKPFTGGELLVKVRELVEAGSP